MLMQGGVACYYWPCATCGSALMRRPDPSSPSLMGELDPLCPNGCEFVGDWRGRVALSNQQ